MIFKTLLFLLLTIYYLLSTISVHALTKPQDVVPKPAPNAIERIFGKIEPPDQLKGLLQKDPTGAGGISTFLSNFVALMYAAASIMLIFMLLWGAWDWITSGGDKEKLTAARDKLIHAIIGIMLFAVAFAVIQILGQFSGFTFFKR